MRYDPMNGKWTLSATWACVKSLDGDITFPLLVWPPLDRESDLSLRLALQMADFCLCPFPATWMVSWVGFMDLRWQQKNLVTSAVNHLVSRTIAWVTSCWSRSINHAEESWAGSRAQHGVHKCADLLWNQSFASQLAGSPRPAIYTALGTIPSLTVTSGARWSPPSATAVQAEWMGAQQWGWIQRVCLWLWALSLPVCLGKLLKPENWMS
jgi:hypothetical protein